MWDGVAPAHTCTAGAEGAEQDTRRRALPFPLQLPPDCPPGQPPGVSSAPPLVQTPAPTPQGSRAVGRGSCPAPAGSSRPRGAQQLCPPSPAPFLCWPLPPLHFLSLKTDPHTLRSSQSHSWDSDSFGGPGWTLRKGLAGPGQGGPFKADGSLRRPLASLGTILKLGAFSRLPNHKARASNSPRVGDLGCQTTQRPARQTTGSRCHR